MITDILVRNKIAENRRKEAYRAVLQTENGRVVFSDILLRCFHFQGADNHDQSVRQQFAIELLRCSGLYDESTGSFPTDYVSMLTKVKIERPVEKKGFFGRTFGRKTNV